MSTQGKCEPASRILLESRLAYHHRCLREDATDPAMSALERLALVRDRAARIREIERELHTAKRVDADGQDNAPGREETPHAVPTVDRSPTALAPGAWD